MLFATRNVKVLYAAQLSHSLDTCRDRPQLLRAFDVTDRCHDSVSWLSSAAVHNDRLIDRVVEADRGAPDACLARANGAIQLRRCCIRGWLEVWNAATLAVANHVT